MPQVSNLTVSQGTAPHSPRIHPMPGLGALHPSTCQTSNPLCFTRQFHEHEGVNQPRSMDMCTVCGEQCAREFLPFRGTLSVCVQSVTKFFIGSRSTATFRLCGSLFWIHPCGLAPAAAAAKAHGKYPLSGGGVTPMRTMGVTPCGQVGYAPPDMYCRFCTFTAPPAG
jgi:hypothetical protein